MRWEARQLQELLYRDGDDGFGKIVPVVLPGGRVEDLPDWVLPVRRHHLVRRRGAGRPGGPGA